MPNPVVHFEVVGKDSDKLQSFFGDLFGWTIDSDNPVGYGIVEAQDGVGIGGGVAASQNGASHVTFYVAVDDLGSYLQRAKELGGTVVQEVTEIPGMVTFALINTPEGHLIGLVNNQT